MVFLYQSSLSQPQMMVVADLDDVFLPLPDDLLVNLVDSRHVVESFLDSLPNMFHDNVNVESALGPALKAAFMVMVWFLFLCYSYFIRCVNYHYRLIFCNKLRTIMKSLCRVKLGGSCLSSRVLCHLLVLVV
jgi:hypothetical protein